MVNFAKVEITLLEKLMDGALLTSTPELHSNIIWLFYVPQSINLQTMKWDPV